MNIQHTIQQWALSKDYLCNRMSFICGPRQIGKTTLVQNHLRKVNQIQHYHNWDSIYLKQKFANNPLFFLETLIRPIPPGNLVIEKERQWLVFDEIHKYTKWKNLLKGYYDDLKHALRFIISGSARLDYFRASGDSLVGRYFLSKMYPLHPNDMIGKSICFTDMWHPNANYFNLEVPSKEFQEACTQLLNLTGFPEPVSNGTQNFYRRWQKDHISLITQEDLRDLSKINNISKLQILVYLLPERVASTLSLNKIRQTLECSHQTVQNWLNALKLVYILFEIPPYSKKISRSILKDKKYYFWDWGLVEDSEKRFENFIAVQLSRAISAWNEWGLGAYALFFVRTKDGKEVDFLITEKDSPLILIECKKSDTTFSKHLTYFKDRLGVKFAVQLLEKSRIIKQVAPDSYVISAGCFLQMLP
jgi:hypothetical protein